ncbi:MAG: carboxymuconolactone decarboxylase family protein [Mycobacteriaceae bacterium]|nr:carboxymuconolactone decarboxylase family protein [Mycobacteriaceae bacterium]
MTEPRINLFGNDVAMKVVRRFQSVGQPLRESSVSTTILELVNLRASQINGCGMCTDMHAKDLAAAGEDWARLNLVAAWREATVFTEAERAALELAEEGTRIADAAGGVSDEVWTNARKHFDEDQLAVLIGNIALINAWNRLNVIARTPAGSDPPGMFG